MKKTRNPLLEYLGGEHYAELSFYEKITCVCTRCDKEFSLKHDKVIGLFNKCVRIYTLCPTCNKTINTELDKIRDVKYGLGRLFTEFKTQRKFYQASLVKEQIFSIKKQIEKVKNKRYQHL